MAVLSDADRREIWAQFMRDRRCTGGLSDVEKPDLRAAFDAADQWVEDNAASFNAALPEPFRSAASPAQKAALLLYVVKRRFEVG